MCREECWACHRPLAKRPSITVPQPVRDESVEMTFRRHDTPNTGPWDRNQGLFHMDRARRHRRVTQIIRNGFPLEENSLVFNHHCRGLMYRRPKGNTLDRAAMSPSCPWNCFTVIAWPSFILAKRKNPILEGFAPRKRTSGASCEKEWWKHGSCVLQTYRDKPVLGSDLTHDGRNSEHLEPESPERTIQVPQIQNWTQPPILPGNYEVPAVEPGLPVWRRNTLYGLLNQQGVNFLFHHPTLLWVHRSPDHPIELRGAVTELQSALYAGPMEIYSEGIDMRRYNLLRESASRDWPWVFFEYRLRSPEAEYRQEWSKTIFYVRTLSLPGRKP